jgi:transposase-like protein
MSKDKRYTEEFRIEAVKQITEWSSTLWGQ